MALGELQMKVPEEMKQPAQIERKPEEARSTSAETFLRTPEAREFVKDWSSRMKDGAPMYTKRGVTELLRNMSQIPGLSTDKDVLKASGDILTKLGGMDKLQSFLAGWKAKSEGIIRGIKGLFKS
jgi:hypothetical protein